MLKGTDIEHNVNALILGEESPLYNGKFPVCRKREEYMRKFLLIVIFMFLNF